MRIHYVAMSAQGIVMGQTHSHLCSGCVDLYSFGKELQCIPPGVRTLEQCVQDTMEVHLRG